jgi:hypothetical protein
LFHPTSNSAARDPKPGLGVEIVDLCSSGSESDVKVTQHQILAKRTREKAGGNLLTPEEQIIANHISESTTAPEPGVVAIRSGNGPKAQVFAVGLENTFWSHHFTGFVLRHLEEFQLRVGMEQVPFSIDPPVRELSGAKFLLRWSDQSRPVKDLFISATCNWKDQGWQYSQRGQTFFNVLTDTSTMDHRYWQRRNQRRKPSKGDALECPCPTCRKFPPGNWKFQMRIAVDGDSFTSSIRDRIRQG